MKNKTNLTSKIYMIELLCGMIFYGLGILFITPPTNPPFIKYLAVGSLLFVILAIIIFTAFSTTEKLDERALNNFYKSSTITFFFMLFFLLVCGTAVYFIPMSIIFSPAIASFMLAIILILHGSTFRSFELSGK